jgi:L-amino acid N-acyltransferase YncA
MIRKVKDIDAEQICNIYNYYIKNTTITFEEVALSEAEMLARIEKISLKYPFLVYEENNTVIGYAYATEWRVREAYRNSVEITVYLKDGYGGKGIGKQLYTELFKQLREKKFHAVIGGIALPNPASIALHEKFGMQKVAHFKEVGYKFNQWVDVAYWELILE